MNTNVWTRFNVVAASHPGRPAILKGDRIWNFAELRRRAISVAACLADTNLSPNSRVVVSATNSPELAAVLLGIWAIGGIPVLVHAESTIAHVRHAAATSGAALCVLDKTSPHSGTTFECSAVSVEELAHPAAHTETAQYAGARLATMPASILFTSGSTGLPKGVVQPHRNLIVGCDTVHGYLGYDGTDRILCPIPWTFDYGYGQLLTTLCHGLTHILPEAGNPFSLCEAIEAHKPTVFPGLPSWFTYLFRGVSPLKSTDLSTIRIVTNTGGTIPAGVLDHMMIAFAHAEIVLNYGLTESYRSTSLPPSLLKTHRTSIGRPIPGVDIAIVREDGTIANPGETGEIVHRGNGVFLGYWGNPEATAKALRPDPLFPQSAGVPMNALYTGDLGHKDEEGFIYYKGRRDHQIKSMGVRVSPGEIEAIINESNLVKNVAVFSLPQEMIGEAVMAAFEPAGSAPDVIAKLQAHGRKTMSPFMQPRQYFAFETLPKTPGGKIDYVAIRQICREQSKFVS